MFASSGDILANATYLVAVVVSRYGPLFGRAEGVRVLKLAVASVVLWLVVEGSRLWLPPAHDQSVYGALLLAFRVVVGVLTYALTLALLRSPELRAARAVVARDKTP